MAKMFGRVLLSLVLVSACSGDDAERFPDIDPQCLDSVNVDTAAFAVVSQTSGATGDTLEYHLLPDGSVEAQYTRPTPEGPPSGSSTATPSRVAKLRADLEATGIYQWDPGCHRFVDPDPCCDKGGSGLVLYMEHSLIAVSVSGIIDTPKAYDDARAVLHGYLTELGW